MSLPRLLSFSIVAILCTLPAGAQSHTAPPKPASEFQAPTLPTESIPFLLQAPPPAAPPLFVVPGNSGVNMIAGIKNSGPCYTLRTYGITPHDLESNSPKPSSYSTCTPAATHSLKSVAIPPTK